MQPAVEAAGGSSYEQPSERFLERPEVDLMRPGRARLAVNLSIDFGDRIDVQHAILARSLTI
jgi:hypothetical protein